MLFGCLSYCNTNSCYRFDTLFHTFCSVSAENSHLDPHFCPLPLYLSRFYLKLSGYLSYYSIYSCYRLNMLFHTITCYFLVFLHKIGILTSILAPFRYCDPSKNPSASYPYDEMGESESESITSEPNIDLGVFDEQICGPLPSNDDHVNASPSKYNTTRPGQ